MFHFTWRCTYILRSVFNVLFLLSLAYRLRKVISLVYEGDVAAGYDIATCVMAVLVFTVKVTQFVILSCLKMYICVF
jgi:hypothetical protein